MKAMLLCTFAVLLLASCIDATEYGYARIVGGSGDSGIVGDIYFVTINTTFVGVYASISGITQNLSVPHGMHVHTYGETNDPTIASSGPHYVGQGIAQHGCYPDNREEGDMGNWDVSATGTVDQYKEFDIMTLVGDYSIIGRGVVFHIGTDNCINMTSAGSRLARGVVGVGNPAYFPASKFPVTFSGANTAFNSGNQILTGKAVCYLLGTAGNAGITGTVLFENVSGGVLVTAKILDLTLNSQHGIHVHMYGDISLNNGTSLGDHYNPSSAPHGVPPNTNRHVGDMGNVCYYDNTGAAYYQYLNTLLTISGSNPVTNVIGRSVSLHANLDTGNTTSYGARIAQCVIGIANNSTLRPTSTVTDNDVSCGVVPSTTTTTTTTSTSGVASVVASGMMLVVALIALLL